MANEAITTLPTIKTTAQSATNQVFESMSGSTTTVLFEFPNYDEDQGSVFILMRSIVSLSVSVHRAKIPVIPLGENSVQGFALGNKTVAGSIIKTLTFDDELHQVVEYYTTQSLADKEANFVKDLGSKESIISEKYQITQKQFDDIMRDDLVPFNIYSYSFSEYSGSTGKMIFNSVYGCTIINEGQVQSIENLITENTFSFIAKYAKLGETVTQDLPSYPNLNTVMTGSQLLANKKR
jgi:hypothetical protein